MNDRGRGLQSTDDGRVTQPERDHVPYRSRPSALTHLERVREESSPYTFCHSVYRRHG
jgi:hypothetical protein